ncbi:MAG: hypothetical protein RL059_1448 [Bacteroidota bacterium]
MHPKKNDSLAQLVEQYTFNVWALGSNPRGITKRVHFIYEVGFFILQWQELGPVSEKNRKAQTMRSIVDAMLGLSQRPGS